jgi:thiol-disulfide isomerase/thioredoxin
MAILLSLFLSAQATEVRDIRGQAVDMSEPVVLVYWSMACGSCNGILKEAAAVSERGQNAVVVTMDAPNAHSAVSPQLRAMGVRLPVVAATALPPSLRSNEVGQVVWADLQHPTESFAVADMAELSVAALSSR